MPLKYKDTPLFEDAQGYVFAEAYIEYKLDGDIPQEGFYKYKYHKIVEINLEFMEREDG
jgi:hypothetical protein